jgi:Tfp pilus assembly protein PilF
MFANNFRYLILDFISGEALFKKGDFQEAELWYRKSLESKADHLPAFLALAKLLSRSPGRIREADDLYKKALELERHNADVYLHYCKYCLV